MPRVSPYRLAAHLASAFAIYAVLLWTTLSLAAPTPALTNASAAVMAAAKRLRGAVHPLAGIVALTAASGDLLSHGLLRLWCSAGRVFLQRVLRAPVEHDALLHGFDGGQLRLDW